MIEIPQKEDAHQTVANIFRIICLQPSRCFQLCQKWYQWLDFQGLKWLGRATVRSMRHWTKGNWHIGRASRILAYQNAKPYHWKTWLIPWKHSKIINCWALISQDASSIFRDLSFRYHVLDMAMLKVWPWVTFCIFVLENFLHIHAKSFGRCGWNHHVISCLFMFFSPFYSFNGSLSTTDITVWNEVSPKFSRKVKIYSIRRSRKTFRSRR